MSITRLLLLLCALLPLAAIGQTPAAPPSLLPLAQRAVAATANGDFTSLKPDMTADMAALLTPAVAMQVKAQLFDPLGAVQSVTLSGEQPVQGLRVATFVVHLAKGTLNGEIAVDAHGKIAGLHYAPSAPSTTFAHYVTKATVRLPFQGAWYAFWGGTDANKNYHASDRAQKYAYDLVIMKNGVTHRGDGMQNTDYYAYGQPILSPIAGTVEAVIDGVPENKPGQMNPYMATGNCVIINDGQGEWALLAHLQPHKIRVKVGETVTLGQSLGLCGNSGNSSEPHLHFHMQNGPNIADSTGLPITVRNFSQDGKHVESGVPDGKVTLENKGQ